MVFISYIGILVIHLTVDGNVLLSFYILQSAFHCMCFGYRAYIQSDVHVPAYIICTVYSSSTNVVFNVHVILAACSTLQSTGTVLFCFPVLQTSSEYDQLSYFGSTIPLVFNYRYTFGTTTMHDNYQRPSIVSKFNQKLKGSIFCPTFCACAIPLGSTPPTPPPTTLTHLPW